MSTDRSAADIDLIELIQVSRLIGAVRRASKHILDQVYGE